jgi:hypothetical protein
MLVPPPPKIDSQFFIKGYKTPKAILTVLTILLIMFTLIPLISTGFMLSSGEGIGPGIFIFFVIFWGIAFYLLRVVLWNSFGKEVITLFEDKISYHADFKFFTDSKQEINKEGLIVEIIQKTESGKTFGNLKLTNQNKVIETVLKADIQELTLIVQEIERATTGRYMQLASAPRESSAKDDR